jgi:hypothetical protein
LDGTNKKQQVRIKGIALPNEHGSWGILLEPLVTALAVAPSAAGAFVALAVGGAFLSRQPLKILVGDISSGRRLPQTRIALVLTAAAFAIALSGLAGALYLTSYTDLLPLTVLIPLGIFQVANDISRRSRELVPELAGAAALSASAPAIALAAGWHVPEAMAMWSIFAARSIPSFVYVRQRLRLEKGKDFVRPAPAILHMAAVGLSASLAYFGLVPVATVPVFIFLLWRSVRGLSKNRKRLKAVQLGVRETIYGAVLVLSFILGYYYRF